MRCHGVTFGRSRRRTRTRYPHGDDEHPCVVIGVDGVEQPPDLDHGVVAERVQVLRPIQAQQRDAGLWMLQPHTGVRRA